jgi:hypothetical protein
VRYRIGRTIWLMYLGRLPALMECLADHGTGATIMPVMVEGGYWGGLETRPPVLHREGWEIRYQVLGGGIETVTAPTIPEAVELALADLIERGMALALHTKAWELRE